MITKAEKKAAEKAARACYQDVIKVDVKEDPNDESSLLLIITRGVTMPPVKINRNETLPVIKKVSARD